MFDWCSTCEQEYWACHDITELKGRDSDISFLYETIEYWKTCNFVKVQKIQEQSSDGPSIKE